MLGCASLPGTDPDAVATALSYLHHHVLAPPALRPRAVAQRYVHTDRLPAAAVDTRAALAQLPPLLKAYLRMGGMIGDGAVIDRQFNTIDVCLVLPTEKVRANYLRHYRQQRLGYGGRRLSRHGQASPVGRRPGHRVPAADGTAARASICRPCCSAGPPRRGSGGCGAS